MTNPHDQLRQKNNNLLKLDKNIVTLTESEEDLEQEVIAAEEHSSLSTNISQVVQLLKVCTAVETTVQMPLQQATDRSHPDVSRQQPNNSEDPPADPDHVPPRFRLQDSSRTQDIICLPKLHKYLIVLW